MKFNPKQVGFGRHETFALRYSWLTKGFQAMQENSKIFSAEEATVRLGVGKNMVNAIRYWLLASRLIESDHEGGFQATFVGEALLSQTQGYDPYLEDEATLWLVHWLIASNPAQATACYWFFNYFHKPAFSVLEVASSLQDFASQKTIKSSPKTISNDAALLLRMYSQPVRSGRMAIDEVLDSPLSQLHLITQAPDERTYESKPTERHGLSSAVLGFSVVQLANVLGLNDMPIDDLMYPKESYSAPGAVFRLTENAFITKLEHLMQACPGVFELRDTAGINQLYFLDKTDPMVFLKWHYESAVERVAA
jgi:hypothetical protein